MTNLVIPTVRVRKLNLKSKVMSLLPDFKPYLIAGVILTGLMLANQVAVYIWQIATCNC